MFFSNTEHEVNFKKLKEIYRMKRGEHILNDVQYLSNIYIAAYPKIYDCINLKTLDVGIGPLYNLMEWDDEKQTHVISAAGLTGSTRRLLEAGLSLYNDYPIGLDDVISSLTSDEMFNVFIQACKIRAVKELMNKSRFDIELEVKRRIERRIIKQIEKLEQQIDQESSHELKMRLIERKNVFEVARNCIYFDPVEG